MNTPSMQQPVPEPALKKPAARSRSVADTSQDPEAARTLYQRIAETLSIQVSSEFDLLKEVTRGLPSGAFTSLSKRLHIDPEFVGSESTIRRRLQSGERFTTDESERMVRLARVHALAVELFGTESAAEAWLQRPANFVPGAEPISPYELATRDAGARMVEGRLLRSTHGIF